VAERQKSGTIFYLSPCELISASSCYGLLCNHGKSGRLNLNYLLLVMCH